MSDFFQHPQAIVEPGVVIGTGSRVWAFAHLLSGAVIGKDCNICDHTFIEGQVRLGDRVTIKCGVALWDGIVIEDAVFIGPNAVFTNDNRPRSRKYPTEFARTLLQEGCTIGANSTVLPGLIIGKWSMVGAGAVVTHHVPAFGLVYGNPATLKGWVCRCGEKLAAGPGMRWLCACGLIYEQSAATELRPLEPAGGMAAQGDQPSFLKTT